MANARDLYVLSKDDRPVNEPDVLKWARWFEDHNRRRIASDNVPSEQYGTVFVSTVFLGIDHSFGGPQPVLWETMIFGGPRDGAQWRYASKEAALAGHAVAVGMALTLPTEDDEPSLS